MASWSLERQRGLAARYFAPTFSALLYMSGDPSIKAALAQSLALGGGLLFVGHSIASAAHTLLQGFQPAAK